LPRGIDMMKDGRFRARVRLPDGTRKAIYQGHDPDEAIRQQDEAERLLREGELVTSPRRPLGDWLDQWLADYAKPKADAKDSPRTYEAYEGAVRVRLMPLLGKVRLDQSTASHIQRGYARLAERYAPKTVNFTHTVLAQALGQAAKLGYVSPNLMLNVEVPPRPDPNADDKAITPADLPVVAQVLSNNLQSRHGPAWQFIVDTGLRWGECSGLTWSDIHLVGPRPHVSVRRAQTRVPGGLKSKAPKSKRGRRDVPLTPAAIAALKVQRGRCRARGGRRARYMAVTRSRVPRRPGPTLALQPGARSFKAAQRSAGLQTTYTLHQLRHTYATRHFAAGTHPKTVQELLGHERIDYTLGIYTSSIPEASFAAVRGLPPLDGSRAADA
jgi:integrase